MKQVKGNYVTEVIKQDGRMLRRADIVLRYDQTYFKRNPGLLPPGTFAESLFPKHNLAIVEYQFPNQNEILDLSSLCPDSDYHIPRLHNIDFNLQNIHFVMPSDTNVQPGALHGMPTVAFATYKHPDLWYDKLEDSIESGNKIEQLIFHCQPVAMRVDWPECQLLLAGPSTVTPQASWNTGMPDGQKNIQFNLPQLLYGNKLYICIQSPSLFDDEFQGNDNRGNHFINVQLDYTFDTIKMSQYLFIKEREKNGILTIDNEQSTLYDTAQVVVEGIGNAKGFVGFTALFGYTSEGRIEPVIVTTNDRIQPQTEQNVEATGKYLFHKMKNSKST